MTDELNLVRRYRPATEGPDPEVTAHARRAFAEFLDSQRPPRIVRRPNPFTSRWRRHWVVIASVSAILLVMGGVAVGVFGDGVFYTEPETEVVTTGDLSLVIQESNIGPCLEVRTSNGEMSGSCGADFGMPLNVGVGLIDGKSYASGWTPTDTTELVMTFSNSEELSVTTFQRVDGYDKLFFVVTPVPPPGEEPSLPIKASAYDRTGNELATVTYDDEQ